MDLFRGRRLIIATKHQKETVIAPLLEQALGVRCFVDKTFDTDLLGTFSGEVERQQDPLSTARLKCLKAMEINNCDLGVASEGSFGPHPSLFFASVDDEFIIFIDKQHNLEIVARHLSTDTNFGGKPIQSENELWDFAEQIKFPSHALIIKPSKSDTAHVIKGIKSKYELLKAFENTIETYGKAFVETDMRAMHNPSRMAVIKITTENLVERIQSHCPNCDAPGFGVVDYKKGLPCDLCGSPTESTLYTIRKCQKCGFTEDKYFPNDKQTEDPMYCSYCNP